MPFKLVAIAFIAFIFYPGNVEKPSVESGYFITTHNLFTPQGESKPNDTTFTKISFAGIVFDVLQVILPETDFLSRSLVHLTFRERNSYYIFVCINAP